MRGPPEAALPVPGLLEGGHPVLGPLARGLLRPAVPLALVISPDVKILDLRRPLSTGNLVTCASMSTTCGQSQKRHAQQWMASRRLQWVRIENLSSGSCPHRWSVNAHADNMRIADKTLYR